MAFQVRKMQDKENAIGNGSARGTPPVTKLIRTFALTAKKEAPSALNVAFDGRAIAGKDSRSFSGNAGSVSLSAVY